MRISLSRFFFALSLELSGTVAFIVGCSHHAVDLMCVAFIITLIGIVSLHCIFEAAKREAARENDERRCGPGQN